MGLNKYNMNFDKDATEPIKLWCFYYNYCAHESVPEIVSYHRTKAGAERSRDKHKNAARRRYNRLHKDDAYFRKICKFGAHESWFVKEFDLVIQD